MNIFSESRSQHESYGWAYGNYFYIMNIRIADAGARAWYQQPTHLSIPNTIKFLQIVTNLYAVLVDICAVAQNLSSAEASEAEPNNPITKALNPQKEINCGDLTERH